MRGTLHLVAVEDLDWLLPLLAAAFLPRVARRSAQLGMDEDACRRGIGLIKKVLQRQGPMTRAELTVALASGAVDIRGQRAPVLLCRASLEGVVCHGPPRSGKPTYVLLSDWTEPLKRVELNDALTQLVTRYIAAFGPAGPKDFAAWSGLPVADARSGWSAVADHLTELDLAGRSVWVLDHQFEGPLVHEDRRAAVVRLLAGFDTYLLGYDDRTLTVQPGHSKHVNAGGGMVRPTILIDGQVVGTWRHRKTRRGHELMLEPFTPIPPVANGSLDAEVAEVNLFLSRLDRTG
jgi:hypothetical protein